MEFVFRLAGVSDRVSYLDIGAADPVGHNNTFLSYLRGGRGVLVEADPKYGPAYAELRPRDRVENVALVPKRLVAGARVEFFLAEDRGWSSVSREHLATAERLGKGGIRQTISVPCATIGELLDQHFQDRELHLLSMDVEGIDSEVLREIDLRCYRPWVIVIENDGGVPVHKDFMNEVGYRFYGFTTVNSIYVERRILGELRF